MSIVDFFVRTKTTWPIPAGKTLADFREQPCTAAKLRHGQDVAIVRASIPGRCAEKRITYWRAPDLACQTLTYCVDQEQGQGSWRMLTEERVLSLKLQEPDARLFDDRLGYTEVKLSEVERRLLNKAGVSQDAEPWKTEKERLDKGYSRTGPICS